MFINTSPPRKFLSCSEGSNKRPSYNRFVAESAGQYVYLLFMKLASSYRLIVYLQESSLTLADSSDLHCERESILPLASDRSYLPVDTIDL